MLDDVDRPRFRAVGSRGALRWLRDGVPDVAVVAGESPADADVERVGGWEREWGLTVPSGNPDDVTGLASLVDGEMRFVNRPTDSGLRTALAESLAALADERQVARHEVTDAIDGFDLTARAVESPARKVAAGTAEAGLSLRATAAKLDLGFVPVGVQDVGVYVAPARREKPGVEALTRVVRESGPLLSSLPGYARTD
jgi:putative molybdopterin biosynthesis protein